MSYSVLYCKQNMNRKLRELFLKIKECLKRLLRDALKKDLLQKVLNIKYTICSCTASSLSEVPHISCRWTIRLKFTVPLPHPLAAKALVLQNYANSLPLTTIFSSSSDIISLKITLPQQRMTLFLGPFWYKIHFWHDFIIHLYKAATKTLRNQN